MFKNVNENVIKNGRKKLQKRTKKLTKIPKI